MLLRRLPCNVFIIAMCQFFFSPSGAQEDKVAVGGGGMG